MEACPYRALLVIELPMTTIDTSSCIGGPLCQPARIDAVTHPETKRHPLHGQASRPARKDDRKLAGIPATANTNADERSATSQRQGEGAGFWCNVGAGVGDAEVAVGHIKVIIFII